MPLDDTIRLRRTRFARDGLRLASVRAIVFIAEQRCPFAEEFDGLDEDAVHVLGEIRDEPVACGRLRPLEPGTVKLERLAVLAELRGRGHGRALLEFMMATARTMGARTLTLNAQVQVVGLYEAAGFATQGAVFEEVGIAHLKMSRPA
ncbi:MAG: GNAT family N-acetyltransferase [Burkholderiaceae bacterium]